jgi:hypothetical protein
MIKIILISVSFTITFCSFLFTAKSIIENKDDYLILSNINYSILFLASLLSIIKYF